MNESVMDVRSDDDKCILEMLKNEKFIYKKEIESLEKM
jgi:hypothetical protein